MQTDQKRKGFTLVELMVATSVSLMLVAGLLATAYGLSKSMQVGIIETTATLENLELRRQFESDLRGVSTIISKSDTKFHFITSDLHEKEKEIYYLIDQTGNTIRLVRNEVSGLNIDNALLTATDDGLESVAFTYYNQMGDIALAASDTNAIRIDIERMVEGINKKIDRDLQITMIMFRNKVYDTLTDEG